MHLTTSPPYTRYTLLLKQNTLMAAVFWDEALCVLAEVQESSTQMAVPESPSEIIVQLHQITWCICQKTVSSVNNDMRTSSLITLRHSILYD